MLNARVLLGRFASAVGVLVVVMGCRAGIPHDSLRFDLLSDPHRLEILLVLHRAPGIFVGDLAAALGRSENAVSQALRVLRQQGWVTSTRVGRAVSYRLDDEIVHDLLHWIGARHG